MSRRMLISLVVPLLVCSSLGNGILPLLPLYAMRVGASPAVAGWYTAFTFLCLAAGALLAGRPGGALQRRDLLVFLTLPVAPLIALMGRVTAMWQLAAITALVWLIAGCLVTGINIIASRHAAEVERGRVFGLFGVVFSASSIIGGLGIGRLVDRVGYPAMYLISGGYYLIIPLALLLLPRGRVEPVAAVSAHGRPDAAASRLGSAAFLFLIAELVAFTANGAGQLGRSLLMNARGLSASAITSTMVIGSLVTLPVPFALGWLSDRIGRRIVLIACTACGVGSLILLAVADALWHFWIVGVLLAVLGVSVSIGPAFIADLVPSARVGSAMSLFQTAWYLASIAGMSALVPVAGAIGMSWALVAAAAVAAVGVILVLGVRGPKPAVPVSPP